MPRVERAEPGPTRRDPAHRQHAWVVGVQDVPPVRPRDTRDRRLHLGELVDRLDAVEAEVVLGDVGHDRHVVVEHADPAEQDAAPRSLEDGDVGLLGERPRRAAEPRVVALLDQVAVAAIDTVGRGVRDASARRSDDVGEEPDGGGLAVRARHRDHRGVGIGHVRLVAGFDGLDPAGGLGEQAVDRPAAARRVQEGRHLVSQRLGRPSPPPRERDDHLVGFGTGSAPDGEPYAARRREPRREAGRQPCDGPPALIRSGATRSAARPGSLHRRREALLGDVQPPADADRQLHRGAREVQVRAVEHTELDEVGARWGHERELSQPGSPA